MADNKHRGPTLDSFLEEEGVLAEFQARAIKEVIALQLAEAMKERIGRSASPSIQIQKGEPGDAR